MGSAMRALPKEMLPVAGTPVIRHVVEELAAVGICQATIVISEGKESIREYFEGTPVPGVAVTFAYQPEPLGLGHAVVCGRGVIGDEPFMVLLGDTIIEADTPATRQLLDVYASTPQASVLLEDVPRDQVGRYGIASGSAIADGVIQVHSLVEKPTPEDAASTLAIAGRYIFPPAIFECLGRITPGVGGELQLTDAMRLLLADEPMLGVRLKGQRYDVGTEEAFIEANVAFAGETGATADDLRAQLRQRLAEM